MRRQRFWILIAGCLGACSPREPSTARQGHDHDHDHGADPSGPAAPVDAKHAELLDIAAGLRESTSAYYGRLRYRELEAQDATGMSPKQKAEHAFALGFEKFKFGEAAAAESLFAEYAQATGDLTGEYFAGVAALRVGEEANCLARHNAASCLLPLAGDGVHADPGGARRAIPRLARVAAEGPREHRLAARYLANLASMALDEWPDGLDGSLRIDPSVFASPGRVHRFRDRAMGAGMTVMNHAGGAAMDDFDGDGFLDVITSTSLPEGRLLFYRSRGDGTFEEIAERSGLAGQLGGLNLVHADYDGDGNLDVLILRGGWLMSQGCQPRSLLRNTGGGRFVDVTAEAGLDDARYPCQNAAFADYDRDGDLDVFLGNEALVGEAARSVESAGFEIPSGGDLPYPSQLFRNDGGRFTDVAEAAGVTNLRFAKGAAWGDYDDDGDPDLYVSNQWGENRLYRNEANGRFTDVAPQLGMTGPVSSFPVWAWDWNGDGRLEFFVAGYRGTPSQVVRSYLRPELEIGEDGLYRNDGATFANVAHGAGLVKLTPTMGANFADVDGDGWLDFYLGTGSPRFDALVPNVLYRGEGGVRFADETFAAGLGQLQKGHGVAFGDIDNDGDEDLFLQSGGFFDYDAFFNSLFENPGHGNRWITLRLAGADANRFAMGARIRVTLEEGGRRRVLTRWVWPAGSFGSSSLQQEIGLGHAERVAFVEVTWPRTGLVQRFEGLAPDRAWVLREGVGAPEPLALRTFRFPDAGGTP